MVRGAAPTDIAIGPWLRQLGLPAPTHVTAGLSAGARSRLESSLERRRRFLAQLGAHDVAFHGNEDVLDVGCGRGASTVALARRVGRVVGIDVTYSPEQAARALHTSGLTNAAVYEYGLINRHYSATEFPVRGAHFDLIVSYRGIGRLDLWHGSERVSELLHSGGRAIVLYPHFWYPLTGLTALEAELDSYAARRLEGWEQQSFTALRDRWRDAGLRLRGAVDEEFPPAHVRSYVLELTGLSRWTTSRDLGFTSQTMIRTALLLADHVGRA